MDGNSAKLTKLVKGTWEEVESSKDVLLNILSRLPATDLVLFRTLSSHWRSVIRSPALVEEQLSFSKDAPIFVVFPYIDWVLNIYLVSADGEVLEKINIPGTDNLSLFRMNCSGNGLVCFTNCPYILNESYNYDDPINNDLDGLELDIHIFNPCTNEVLLLPRGTPSDVCVQTGMSFGPGIAEYKVFRFFCDDAKEEDDDVVAFCEVFTPHSGSWRRLPNPSPDFPMNCNSVFVDSKVYWFIPTEEDRTVPDSILVADKNEDFWEIEIPVDLDSTSYLTELHGQLGIIAVFLEDMIMHLWLLKYENNGYYWKDYCSDYLPFEDKDDPIETATASGNNIFIITESRYFLYNLGSRKWKELNYNDEFDMNTPAVLPFTGSLVPCDGVMGPDF